MVNIKKEDTYFCQYHKAYICDCMSTAQKVLRKIIEYLVIFVIGGSIYYAMEILWRGYSHYSMFIVGGVCLIIIGLLNEGLFPKNFGILPQCIMGAVIITSFELVAGLIVNKWLGLNVWDYSNMPLNLWGQICLPFTLLWVAVSFLAIVVDDYIRYLFFGEPAPHYSVWIGKSGS